MLTAQVTAYEFATRNICSQKYHFIFLLFFYFSGSIEEDNLVEFDRLLNRNRETTKIFWFFFLYFSLYVVQDENAKSKEKRKKINGNKKTKKKVENLWEQPIRIKRWTMSHKHNFRDDKKKRRRNVNLTNHRIIFCLKNGWKIFTVSVKKKKNNAKERKISGLVYTECGKNLLLCRWILNSTKPGIKPK